MGAPKARAVMYSYSLEEGATEELVTWRAERWRWNSDCSGTPPPPKQSYWLTTATKLVLLQGLSILRGSQWKAELGVGVFFKKKISTVFNWDAHKGAWIISIKVLLLGARSSPLTIAACMLDVLRVSSHLHLLPATQMGDLHNANLRQNKFKYWRMSFGTATECVLLASWWEQGLWMFCELVHTVQRDESVWNLPVRLLACRCSP